MVNPYPHIKAKLIAEIDFNLKTAFMERVESRGQSQRFVIEKLLTDYLNEDETAPKGFPKKTIRRTQAEL